MNDRDQSIRQSFDAFAREQVRFREQLLGASGGGPPPFAVFFRALTDALAANPDALKALHDRLYREQWALWEQFFVAGANKEPPPAETDKRFKAAEWQSIPWFDYLRRTYAITSSWLADVAAAAVADSQERRRLRFYVQQLIDAMAPTNCALTNPEAIRLALQTRGASIDRGWANLSADMRKGRISMTDESAFEVGRNLALTPGAVVYRNDLIELLQYRSATATVHELPLLIVPPCINKYYVLDLQPENSFVRYAVEQGLTVFMISWRNIPPELGGTHWDDYLADGILRAIDVAREICAVRKLNSLGFCVGGTLLASALALLRRKRRRPAASLTLLASMLDFSDPGDISAYINQPFVEAVEARYANAGVLPGAQLAAAFASLRANDLVWHYVTSNYLLGRSPPAFDLLYWNSDSANLPGPMYAYYLRHMYLENALREPDRLTMCGVPVDIGKIDLPSYVLATREDHIVPWTTAYESARLLGRRVEFVLGESGHIAGVVNPASRDRRSYWTGPIEPSPRDWLSSAREHPGSWWKHWAEWIKPRSGKKIPPRSELGSAKFRELANAPGDYVRVRS